MRWQGGCTRSLACVENPGYSKGNTFAMFQGSALFAQDGCFPKSLISRSVFADIEPFRTRDWLKSFRVLKSSTLWTFGPESALKVAKLLL